MGVLTSCFLCELDPISLGVVVVGLGRATRRGVYFGLGDAYALVTSSVGFSDDLSSVWLLCLRLEER